MKTLEQKLGLKPGRRMLVLNAPEDAPPLNLDGTERIMQLRGELGIILAFVGDAKAMDASFSKWKLHVAREGRLWVAWPKRGRADRDLTIKDVIRIGYEHGMVESNAISVSESWSALKFTHPRAGKIYNNSYGILNESAIHHYRR